MSAAVMPSGGETMAVSVGAAAVSAGAVVAAVSEVELLWQLLSSPSSSNGAASRVGEESRRIGLGLDTALKVLIFGRNGTPPPAHPRLMRDILRERGAFC